MAEEATLVAGAEQIVAINRATFGLLPASIDADMVKIGELLQQALDFYVGVLEKEK